MGWYSALWVGIPSLGLGCLVKRRHALRWVLVPAGAPRAEAINASAWVVRTRHGTRQVPVARWQERSTPITGRVPSDRRDQPRPPNGVQRVKDLNTPTRWTGPGTEGYINSAWSGPRCLQRATSNPQRQHSLVGDPSRERIRSVRSYPGNRDRAPKISMVGNLGKAKQHGHYHSLRSIKRGLATPPR